MTKTESVWPGTVRTSEPENVNAAIRTYVKTIIRTLAGKSPIGYK